VLARKSQRAEEVARLSDELRLVEPSGSETARSTNVPLPETSQLRRERYDVWAKDSPGDRLEADDTRTRVEPPARRGRSAGWRIRRSRHGTGCRDPRAGRTIRLPGTYVVARGDTLWHISRRHYRRGYRYGRIYRANRRKIRDPHWIYPCQKFWLPRTRWRR
jgi:nucleoid-associated protein YgaU